MRSPSLPSLACRLFIVASITTLLSVGACAGGAIQDQEIEIGGPEPSTALPPGSVHPPGDSNTNPPTPTSEPAPPTRSRGTCKRGVAADAGAGLALSPSDLAAISPQVSWWYNWASTPGSKAVAAANANLNIDYVPMAFTLPFNSVAAASQLAPEAAYLLTFNEPNFNVQGNLTPEQAAAAWPQIQKFADDHNLAIVSPALNYCGGACNETDPFVWFDKFFAACNNCRIDYLAIHAYVCYDAALKSAYLEPFFKKYGKKLWLTEFSCLDGSADASKLSIQKTFMAEAVADLEANPNVFRYAWFLARSTSSSPPLALLGADGKLTELGSYYLSLPQSCQP